MPKKKEATKAKTDNTDYLKNRVVLALSKEDAKDLNWFLTRIKDIPFGDPARDTTGITKISARLTKTLNKREKGVNK